MRSAHAQGAQAALREPQVRPSAATRCARVLVALMLALAFVAASLAASADASVFENGTRWTTGSDGYTLIRVCIVDGSSADETDGGARHDPNPSLANVLGQVRDALRDNWEAYSSVRFVGWQDCSALNQSQRYEAAALYIDEHAGNSSRVGTRIRGITHCTPECSQVDIRFRPWGNDELCIWYNGARAVMEYQFSCVREYAVHEFGHAIGFVHEWQHPDTPEKCSNAVRDPQGNLVEQPLDPTRIRLSTTYDKNYAYTIPNLDDGFDRDSIMTYINKWVSKDKRTVYDDEGTCADRTGERFGSRELDSWDRTGVAEVYPPVELGEYDVGVVPNARGSCPEPTEMTVYMDNEDDDNRNDRSGWIGAISSGRNTTLVFCKIKGRQLGRLPAPSDRDKSATYAVLKLGKTCPEESKEFVRRHDDEDDLNYNWMAGEVGPTQQNEGGSTSTELHWCLFEQVPPSEPSGNVMINFPKLDFQYGVVAPQNFSQARRRGWVRTDDEDTNNNNRLTKGEGWDLDPRMFFVVRRLMDFGRNTKIHLASVPG